MSLTKQPVNINFSQGVQTKIDKWQLPIGQFERLTNSIFTKAGMLQKRNGFGLVVDSPASVSSLATLNGGLVTFGNDCQSYSRKSDSFTDCGMFQAMELSAVSMVRSATSQTTCDVAVTSNGLAVSTWLDSNTNSYYQISDSETGQIIIPSVQLPATATMSRAYVLGGQFVVTFLATVTGTPHLQYIAIPINNPSNPSAATDISTQVSSLSAAYDGQIADDKLYLSWNGSDGGGAIRTTWLTTSLLQPAVSVQAGETATRLSITADISGTTPVIWITYFKTNAVKAMAYNYNLIQVLAPTNVTTALSGVNEITATATNNVLTAIYEVANTYAYSPNAKTDYIEINTLTLAGVAGVASIILRGVGLASRAIISTVLDKTVMLATYGQALQPTLFLIDIAGNVLSRFAYSNGIGYLVNQVMPNIYEYGNFLQVGYLLADQIVAVNKEQAPAGNVSGVYAQTGINLMSFELNTQTQALEIGGSLQVSGGMLWQYDGVKVREHGFNVWPEDISYSSVSSTGHLEALKYFYSVTYEWTDAAGQVHRSAPSVPKQVNLEGTGSSTNKVTLYIPTLRQTYKTDNKVRIVVYRWSTANQTYYQISNMSLTTGDNPLTLNNPAVDYVTFVDVLADASIIGNNILYTTGGVLENVAGPAPSSMCLFQSRYFWINAENKNLIGFSKQVIQNTPVEISDLLSLYIAPTTGAQGSTGDAECLSSMDDKLIIFKKDAIYYINGIGPDNTGANGSFGDPVFITSTVGCANQQSIVQTPNGIMFQSDKGIWLLGRDLSTTYIGAQVEDFTDVPVTSALALPATNQVRFTLDGTIAIMYDYYYQQWGDWTNISAQSSVIFEDLHTYLNNYGQILQETPDEFLDYSQPVLMSFKTGWFNVAGLQGYQRFYEMQLLGKYLTPHFLEVNIGYDYNPGIMQNTVIMPINFSENYGVASPYGDGIYGGPSNVEEWRLFPAIQKCESFQIEVKEFYDSTHTANSVVGGAGLTLSGLLCLVGVKKGSKPQSAQTTVG